uniref:Uncharacterized protein n=1 Tax=Oryza brachyantha TaxID=4533 RepID=J3N1V7_ORYBR
MPPSDNFIDSFVVGFFHQKQDKEDGSHEAPLFVRLGERFEHASMDWLFSQQMFKSARLVACRKGRLILELHRTSLGAVLRPLMCNPMTGEVCFLPPLSGKERVGGRGFMENYTCWSKHGEQEAPDVEANEEVLDQNRVNVAIAPESMFVPSLLGGDTIDFDTESLSQMLHDIEDADDNDKDFEKFSKLVKDCQMPLYDGCKSKHNKLPCVLKLIKLKASNGWPYMEVDNDMIYTRSEVNSVIGVRMLTKKHLSGAQKRNKREGE